MTTDKEQEAFGLVLERHKSSASENDIRAAFQRFMETASIAALAEKTTEGPLGIGNPGRMDLYVHNTCVEFKKDIVRNGLLLRRKRFRIRYDKIVAFEPFSDGFGIMRDAQTAKPQTFQTGDGWSAYNLAANLAQMQPASIRIKAPTKPLALQLLKQPDTHGAPAEGAGYAAPHQTGAPQRADAGRNRARTANCLHTGPSPEAAAVSDHILSISSLKWAMINCLEAFGNRLIPASGTGPAFNKGRTVHPNPENNWATSRVTGRTAGLSN